MRLHFEPIYDKEGNLVLHDIYVDGVWAGSRRTVEQCEDEARWRQPAS